MPRARTLATGQAALERAETAAARQVAEAYNRARRELLASLLELWTTPGPVTPADAQRLLRTLGLLDEIDRRLLEIEQEAGVILRNVVIDAEERALEDIRREVGDLPANVRQDMRSYTRINNVMIEQYVPVAVDDIRLASQALRLQLRRELQIGLLQGESFPALISRLMSVDDPSVFRNGRLSAERAARRLVVQAENAAKQGYLAQVRRQIPAVRKQAIAAIGGNTTDCCLRVHGQIVEVDEPFVLTGTPRFADRMQYPGFHWNCRTTIVMHHPAFEAGAMSTERLRADAQAEQRRRNN